MKIIEPVDTKKVRVLLKFTENKISWYRDFMAGQGNWDEFEDELYSHHFDGAYEDYLMFGNKILEILYRRKRQLEKILKGDGDNE